MKLGRITGRTVLAVWFIAMLAVGTTLLARHAIALPQPTSQEIAPTVARFREDHGAGFVAIHALYADCRCSQRIAAHLLSSKRPAGLEEHVLFVGKDPALEARFASRGFHVHAVDESALANDYHVLAAPLLVVAAPDGTIRYSGGYTLSKQAYEAHDLAIVAEVMAGKFPEALPLFGCAVSQSLKKQMNPLEVP